MPVDAGVVHPFLTLQVADGSFWIDAQHTLRISYLLHIILTPRRIIDQETAPRTEPRIIIIHVLIVQVLTVARGVYHYHTQFTDTEWIVIFTDLREADITAPLIFRAILVAHHLGEAAA